MLDHTLGPSRLRTIEIETPFKVRHINMQLL